MLDLKDEMKSKIKITGWLKSGGQLFVIKKGRKGAEEVPEGNVWELQHLFANAK
jgi:hypothetical protein